MNNGQLNIVSVQTVMPMATLDSTATLSGAATIDGVQQKGGEFAGLLSGMQLGSKEKDLPDSGQAKQSSNKVGKLQAPLDAGSEDSAVGLLALLQVSPRIAPAAESAELKPDDHEKTDVSTDAVPLGSKPSDVTSQMAMAAYLQSGRMPEVNIPAPVPVDLLQNVITATDQSAAIAIPVVKLHTKQVAADPPQATAQKPAAALAEKTVVQLTAEQDDHLQPETVQATAVDRQPVTTLSAAPAVQATLTVVQPEATFKTEEVNKPTAVPVDKLQNVATATVQPAAEQSQQRQPETVRTISVEGQPVTTAATALHTATTAPASSPESEVEVQLSQPRPITARVAALPSVADNHPAGLVQETQSGRQRRTPEQLNEKGRNDNESSNVKELTSLLQSSASDGESTLGSESSGGDNNQGHPDSASDNQMLAQQMRGSLSTDHQKVAALSTKAVPTEPVRQDVSEQVMLQVKERLVQHDVKPGSQQITLTLSPDSLGELKINLNLQGQKLSVEIVTENRTVRDAIVQHTAALKESLARQNITMESFDVTTGGKGSGNQGQNQNAWRELAKQQQQQQLWTSPRGYHTAQADLPSGQAAYQRPRGDSMLDIHY